MSVTEQAVCIRLAALMQPSPTQPSVQTSTNKAASLRLCESKFKGYLDAFFYLLDVI